MEVVSVIERLMTKRFIWKMISCHVVGLRSVRLRMFDGVVRLSQILDMF